MEQSQPSSGPQASAQQQAGMTAQQLIEQLQQMQQHQTQMANMLQAAQNRQAELEATVATLQHQLSVQAVAAATAASQPAVSQPAVTESHPFRGVDLLKQAVEPPKSLSEKGAADWERFVFHVETFLALMDVRYPEYLDETRRSQKPCAMEGMAFDYRMLSIKLFGLITSWTQDAPSAVKIARGIQGQNGFELWRVLWREYHPEQTNKSLIWRRTLLSPKFPTREADFSAALQEGENYVDRYAAEFGAERAIIADEDKRTLLITESPAALKQHLAMHAATLTTYEQVRAVVVSYLQAKRVWIPTATYAAGHTARARDPDAMNVDKIDDKKGKRKGKQEKGKKGEGKKKRRRQKERKRRTRQKHCEKRRKGKVRLLAKPFHTRMLVQREGPRETKQGWHVW